MTAPVDAVLFDLDDTLCAYRRPGAELLNLAFDAVGVDRLFTVEEYHRRYDALLGECEEMVAFRERCFAELATENGHDPDLGRAVARAYASEREQSAVEPLAGAVDAVEALAADHRLGLVTNGAREWQRTKLESLGVADSFETTVFAGFDAPAKPAPEPFEVALDDLRVAADRAVHVGNSLTTDVAGAHAAGLRSVWLREDGREPSDDPHHVVDAPAELVEPPW
jgi:putative hydrolase of the HAD superfamily